MITAKLIIEQSIAQMLRQKRKSIHRVPRSKIEGNVKSQAKEVYEKSKEYLSSNTKITLKDFELFLQASMFKGDYLRGLDK